MHLLYITYIDFGDFQSGSSVRPQRMYSAFEEAGCTVTLLQTQQNRAAERRAAVRKITRWLDAGNRPDLCYVESPSGPIFQPCDRALLRRIDRLGIPMGYFYRDAAYKFPAIFHRPGWRQTLKEMVVAWMSDRDVRQISRLADIVYLPTATMAAYFPFPRTKPLPPACDGSRDTKIDRALSRRCIYVGGVSKRYGTLTMLEAMERLNQNGEQVSLTLVCREAQADFIPERIRKAPWLEIHHVSGKENLLPLYRQADLALYPIEKNAYNDFAFSVKIPEYMEFGLPVVAVNCAETAKFVEKYQIGRVCEDTAEDFAQKIRDVFSDPAAYRRYAENVARCAAENTWKSRAEEVLRDLVPQGGFPCR